MLWRNFTSKTLRQLALLSILLAGAFGQTSQVPYAPGSDGPGPTFTSSQIPYTVPGAYSSIRKVNFKDGRHKKDDPDDHYSERLDSIYYLGGLSSPKGESALVLRSWFDGGGSSSQGGTAQVFTVSDGHLRSVQKIGWDTHFDAGQPTHSFDPRTNTLVIRSAHYIPGDAHCCVSAMDVVTFQWDGARYVQHAIQTELSEYGKREGKTLPR